MIGNMGTAASFVAGLHRVATENVRMDSQSVVVPLLPDGAADAGAAADADADECCPLCNDARRSLDSGTVLLAARVLEIHLSGLWWWGC
jgi:hypothetical protein